MTHGTIILYTLWCDGTHRHRFYCGYTSAGEEGVSVNSHQNSHDAQQRRQMTSWFLFFVRLCQQQRGFVIWNPTASSPALSSWLFWQDSHTSDFFLKGDDCGCPHGNSWYQNPSQRVRSLTVFYTLGFGPSSLTPWLRMPLFSLFIHSKTWPTRRQLIFISVPEYLFFFSITSIRNTFPFSPCSSV